MVSQDRINNILIVLQYKSSSTIPDLKSSVPLCPGLMSDALIASEFCNHYEFFVPYRVP